MLEGLAAWILNNYLGKYVYLNTDQLSIALLSGKVELENVPLKTDALRHLGLPIRIRAGFIGKVKLQIPVRQIRSVPWVIVFEQLYVVASPLPLDEWDYESEQSLRHDLKITALDDLEAKWRLEKDLQGTNYYASSYSSWYSSGTGFVSEIIENLQLKIQDVHIRCEDSFSNPDKILAFGITIDSLTAQSCDGNWQPGFVSSVKGDHSFKLLELQNFAIYWTTISKEETYVNLTVAELAESMNTAKSKKTLRHFILPSVSAQAHLKRNRSTEPLRSNTEPRIICDLLLEEVPLTIVDWQYNQMVTCVKGLENIGKLRAYRRYKPCLSVKEDARAWWLYAISCFYPGGQPAICRPTPTWESCSKKAKENVKYVEIYKKLLMTPTVALTPDEKKIKDDVELDREYEDLKILREVAMSTVVLPQADRDKSSRGQSMLESWFPQWMGWYSSPASNDSTSTSSAEAKQLEGEILQVLADTAENNTVLKRDAVFGQFTFCLKTGTLKLCTVDQDSKETASMLELEFKNLSLTFVSKPRTSAHTVELSLDALYLKDKITRDTMFPVLVGPPGHDRTAMARNRAANIPSRVLSSGKLEELEQQLFYLSYEKKPLKSSCDYRLTVKTKCLDVVYQANAVKWLMDFICLPYQRDITQSRIEAMKSRTKKEFIKNWEQILEGRAVARSTWDLELNISAPQIIFVEDFTDQNSAMAVIDFGRLQLRNNTTNTIPQSKPEFIAKESEDDETFLTPCSTPPVSEENSPDSEELTLEQISQIEDFFDHKLNESNLHNKLYDCYSLEMNDMQVLIGKAKENWRYALNKGSSTLHVLDRFNISLQIERRVVHTVDPLYPSLTLNANLPKLVFHLNENKINSARNLIHLIVSNGLPSPFNNPESFNGDIANGKDENEDSISYDTNFEMSRLLMMQFTVDHMSLELQSRGRSVAELQVAGVKIAFAKKPLDMNITLTVHSLLLVDALQNFGPDFELLVASHKHVGMDSMSGSLRDSDPTSPTSPASPDPNVTRQSATSPVALTQALSTLSSDPPKWPSVLRNGLFVDTEALITIEICLVSGPDPIHIASIQFNNLDIIANQETIVELVGFVKRVFPKSQRTSNVNLTSVIPSSVRESAESLEEDTSTSSIGSTELIFDFHRLNVLLLRGVIKDGVLYGKKICTATMSGAKINATVADKLEVEGSLGGLQVLDLTPEGQMHSRIISVGRDLLLETPHPIYAMSIPPDDDRKAFSFKIVRNLNKAKIDGKDNADVTIRMASLWYTHSPKFVVELQSCATEFKQYLSNLAKSIRMAATDMALGLVHARAEALAQSLSMNKRLPSSIYGSALSFTDSGSPGRRRRRSSSNEPSGFVSARDTIPQTPYSPVDDDDFVIDVNLDIELDSPVLVLPRSHASTEVFVAHLGKIKITNSYSNSSDSINDGYFYDPSESRKEHYDFEVRDMNIYSLNISSRRVPGPMISKPEVLYSCKNLAKPILHDTMLQLNIDREIRKYSKGKMDESILLDNEEDYDALLEKPPNVIEVSGSIVTALKVSLSRSQYEQVLDTVQWLTSSPTLNDSQGVSRTNIRSQPILSDITEEDTGVTTLNMDPHIRAKLFSPSSTSLQKNTKNTSQNINLLIKVNFELPIFTIELRGDGPNGEQGLVDLSFQDFKFNYEKSHKYETNVLISLRSIFMEDLLQPEGSRQRSMVISSNGSDPPPNTTCVSRSCPDITSHPHISGVMHGSLPDHLETGNVFGTVHIPQKNTENFRPETSNYPSTPPPSPTHGRTRLEKNLVLVSSIIVDPAAPNFDTQYNSTHRSTSVDFSCLDLVISVPSWVVVIDFFSGSNSSSKYSSNTNLSSSTEERKASLENKHKALTDITVCSLTVVLVKPDMEIARANISSVEILINTRGLYKEVTGKLGSMSLLDMTLHGQIYRERFLTSGKEALQFQYIRHAPSAEKEYDALLKLDMASVMYVHTKRFVAEIQAFFNKFIERQATVMKGIHAATSGKLVSSEPFRLSLNLKVGYPIILLPVSSKSTSLLIIDLGQLVITNTFKLSGDEGTISVLSDTESKKKCLLEVMHIDLENMDLYTGIKESELSPLKKSSDNSFKFGSSFIMRKGPSLLTKKFELKLQYERNLYKNFCHIVADSSIYGNLSTLDGALDLQQYKLIRGLLTYNLGEDTERIFPSVYLRSASIEMESREEWIISSIKLSMQNVSLRLVMSHGYHSPLTCINFIKSHLTVETFSNLSQDVDLVSQEILVLDTRFEGSEHESKNNNNVFTNILQPIKNSTGSSDLVQAEIHSRRRQDHIKVTILLNNMRLMAIFDWWESVREFIFQEFEIIYTSPEHQKITKTLSTGRDISFELKLNVTDSELVVVEDSSQWDSNAVILKSTTVVKYRPNHLEKPLSCSLNNCEMFSCILGIEDETALSIIDPITLNIEVVKDGLMEIQLQFLTVRLSYHDMCMFKQMLDSLPKQFMTGQEKEIEESPKLRNKLKVLMALGFSNEDCLKALEICENRLDDAAIWLTQHAKVNYNIKQKKTLDIKTIELKASCISICIIDDCGDSDVPLIELLFSDLEFVQTLPDINFTNPVGSNGYIHCSLASDYYNRVLSGWEPIIEPWICKISWEKNMPQMLKTRLKLKVQSDHTLNFNMTSTFMDLYRQVKENWINDFMKKSSVAQKGTMSFRRRSPFIPFALKNDTGSSLKFTLLLSNLNTPKPLIPNNEDNWIIAEAGDTIPFSFTNRDKSRYQNSHKLELHYLTVKIDGWHPVEPITIDKVGTYFRDTPADVLNRNIDIPPGRVVFDVALEGSARKLVTVRSGLRITNNLPHAIEMKLESRLPHDFIPLWLPTKNCTLEPKGCLALPIAHAHSLINIRPTGLAHQYTFSNTTLMWNESLSSQRIQSGACHTHKGDNYRFCAQSLREKVLVERNMKIEQPMHQIVLMPPLMLVNLLPLDLQYALAGDSNVIKPGCSAALTHVDLEQDMYLEIRLENFKMSSHFVIVPGITQQAYKIKLEDSKQRKLYLTAEVSLNRDAKIKISILASYWIVNRTGLPIVFKQSGTSMEAAGQFDEHEQARMVSPLLFSFLEHDTSQTINARVGKRVVWDGTPQWCSNFHVRKGTQYRKLYVTIREDRSDRVFIIGIEVRFGRGKYRNTTIIFISPRFQLHNKSSYKLAFAQSHMVKNSINSPQSRKAFMKAVPNSHLPFHWSVLDKPLLLSVSIEDIPDCGWSGGFQIDTDNSMHINIRDANSRVYFLRLEVVLQGATYYVVFTDADTMPPPIRVDNFSEVSIIFGQSGCELLSTARAHSSVPYALDEPTKANYIKLIAPGGVTHAYNLNNLGPTEELTYENFIYIAFVGTFKNHQKVKDPQEVECQELVLDIGRNNKVILARKIPGQRSQLWKFTSEGYLQHEGSSPPTHPNSPVSQSNILVLDIADTAPQPSFLTRLALRKIDRRRLSTQRWRFTGEGRLCCDHYNMCVQSEDGFFGLREGSAAVLGLPQPVCHKLTDKGIPIEQAVEPQRLRPGSGVLTININMDGPTQVITIMDVKEKRVYALSDDREWGTISQRPRLTVGEDEDTKKDNSELQFNLNLKGIGISVVSRQIPEELIYAHFSNIIGETVITPRNKQFCISVKDLQIDNQLLDAPVPVVLYVTPPRTTEEAEDHLPAIDLKSEIQEQQNNNAVIFKYFILSLQKITAIIEEKLLLKLFAFVGLHIDQEEVINRDENDYETQRLLSEVSAASAKRYYFGVLQLKPGEIRLSVRTAGKLSGSLHKIKKKLGLTLINFEDATITLDSFERKHPFETSQFLYNSIIKHFKVELVWQAAVILGSVDFIGNPMGLMNDVSEGFSGLIYDRNVGALVKNVTHGLSNTAAKVTESLSDGLGKIAMDDYHEEMRHKIRQVATVGRSSDHILAGLKGFGFGILGGATGIFKQVYEGASNEGLPGVFYGLGKGVVGAVTKPVVGVLDLASETARAVRDSSRSKLIKERKRLPRCVHGPGSLLPRYDALQSQGQQYLYIINDKNYEEKLLAYQVLRSGPEDLLCIVSDKMVRIVTGPPDLTTIIPCHLSDLESCNVIKDSEKNETKYYIEIVMHHAGLNAAVLNPDPIKRPKVRCNTAETAVTTAQQINCARTLYIENLYTLIGEENNATLED